MFLRDGLGVSCWGLKKQMGQYMVKEKKKKKKKKKRRKGEEEEEEEQEEKNGKRGFYFIDQELNLIPQLVLSISALHLREGFIQPLRRGTAHIRNQVAQILRALQLNLPLDR